jgi:hypothetical protein
VSRPTVIGWRERYAVGGIRALEDEPRSGCPAVIDDIDVVAATLANDGRPPEPLGITHWSARFLAAELGISYSAVARIWRRWGIQPHRVETFKFSTDLSWKPRSATSSASTSIRQLTRLSSAWMRSRRCRRWIGASRCYRRGQLRRAQAPEGEGVAARQPAGHPALHPHRLLLAEHGRDLLRHHHPPGHAPRHLPLPRTLTNYSQKSDSRRGKSHAALIRVRAPAKPRLAID